MYKGLTWCCCYRSHPKLTDFTDLKAYALYMAFQVEKKNSITTLSQQVSHAKKVLAFFKTTADSARLRELVQATEWLDKLGKQLKILIPRSAHSVLQVSKVTTSGKRSPLVESAHLTGICISGERWTLASWRMRASGCSQTRWWP
jgi:hypothetical protein